MGVGDFVIENGVLAKYEEVGGGVAIPEGVKKIGKDAFSRCRSLGSVTIPEGVTEIGAYAFGSCSSLESVTTPDGVTDIRCRYPRAFSDYHL